MTKRRLPPMRSISALEAVVRTGSVSAAAAELSVTHGAVSKQLSQLDDWIGRPMFRERRRGMVASASGERLARAVGEALDLIERTVAELRSVDEPTVLTVVSPATFAMRWLIPHLPSRELNEEEIGVRVRPTHTIEDWDALHYDLIVRRHAPLAPELSPRPLFVEQLGFLIPPALLGKGDVRSIPLVDAATRAGELTEWFDLAFGAATPHPPKIYPHFYVALEAALAGRGGVVGPVELVAQQLEDGTLVEPRPDARIEGAAYRLGISPNGSNVGVACDLADIIIRRWHETQTGASLLRV